MTTRSIVLGTAALLLLSAAAPVQFGFLPVAAIAQEISAEVRAALAADPSQLEARQVSEHVRVLRDAIKSGAFTGADKKAAQEKMRALREVLKQLRAGRKETAQVTEESEQAEPAQQAEQAEPEESVQGQQPQSKAERQAEKAARRAERQAEKAAREAEKQARQAADSEAEEQARQPAQQAQTQQAPTQQAPTQQAQPQQPAPRAPAASELQLSPGMIAALRDTRPASELEPGELRERIQTLRSIGQLEGLNEDERAEVRARMTADREALQARRTAGQEQAAPQATPETAPRQSRAEKMPEAEVEQTAQAIMSDSRPAGDLDDEALRKRLNDNRAILETGQLSKAEIRDLRQQLRQDRRELRARVASTRNQAEAQAEDDADSTSGSQSSSQSESVSESQSSAEATANVNVNVVIEERRASDTLSDTDLERRVRALNRALKEERLARRDAEIAMQLIEQDRRELRQRLNVERDRRRARRRSGDTVFIEFDAGYRPPQVIFAAEAMPRQIEMQLVAPPARQISRRYSVQEIASNQEVREMMPGIEIDTLNFDFGSAEVRPEEIDKLDAIAEVIERIVAARPDEVFLIEGHTDAVGSDQANQVLSQRRSLAVAQALLDYYAIDPENLQTVGLGERFLKVWTEEPEEENRRVTIRRITPLLAGGQG